MDIEIIKGSNAIRLEDYGILVKDFIVSSISLDPHYGNIEGRSGNVDYGATYESRTITVPFTMIAHDLLDFPLLRDELFSIVNTRESFYVRELRRPKERAYKFIEIDEQAQMDEDTDNRYVGGKRYLVRLQNVIELDQMLNYGDGELVFETTELPFAESIGTSADIDNPELIPLIPGMWAEGFWDNTVTILKIDSDTEVRYDSNIYFTPNMEYELITNGNYEARVRFYSENRYLGQETVLPNESRKFVVPNNTLFGGVYIRNYHNGSKVSVEDVGSNIDISLKKTTGGANSYDELWGFGMGLIADDDSLIYTHTGTEFRIFNPGVEVHPFERDLVITISDVVGSTDFLQLENVTTGDIFRVTESVKNNQLIKLDGPNITSNNLQYLRKTNRKYITLAPGWNNFKITGATSAKVSFDTRFYYP